jgi:hypothetical protein
MYSHYGSEWYWIRDGQHRMERRTSTDWALFDPMADVMRRVWSWWTLTGRDEAFRAGLPIQPWKEASNTWVFLTGAPGQPAGSPERFPE